MNTLVNKISLAAIALFSVVALGVSLTNSGDAVNTNATGPVVYEYISNTDSSLSTTVSQTANWVLTDANDPAQTFTFNIGSYTSPNTILGGTAGTTLTGTLPGQFVYGNPTLKSLATTTNLTSTKKLYGFRMNGGLDLTNYRDVTVTISWSAGAAVTYTGFIAKSTTGSAEAWSLLTTGKQTVNCGIDSSLSFTDTANTLLMGQTGVKFALIFGGASSKLAMKNVKITVTANPRKTLNSVSGGSLNNTDDYKINDKINLNIFDLTANYSYPTGSQQILGSDSRVEFSENSSFSPLISKTEHSYGSIGQKTLFYRLTDTTLTAGVNNTAFASMTFIIGTRTLTGIQVIEANTATLYRYDRYTPMLSVYPLFGDATEHNSLDAALGASDYTMSYAAGTPLVPGTYTNTITLVAKPTITKDLTISVSSDRDSLTPTLSLSGQTLTFFRDDPFSLGNLVVTADWALGGDTYPSYSSSASDGFFTVSKAPGTQLSAVGTEEITVTYHVNSRTATTTYTITVENYIYTFFNHMFTDGTEWGAKTTADNRAITNRFGSLTNSVSGWSTVTDWVLNTTGVNMTGDNGAFVAKTVDGGLEFLRFGTDTAGPATVAFAGATFPAITNAQNTLNGIRRITIDAAAGAASSLTVSVAGIAPTQYAINYGAQIDGATAPMTATEYNSYTFYFDHTVIGKIRVNFTNNATPKYFDLGNFSVVGYNLPLTSSVTESQVAVFANMLDHTNTCTGDNYSNLKEVYDYLNHPDRNVASELASYTMHLQKDKAGNLVPINALQLWTAYAARWSGTSPSPESTTESLVGTGDTSTVLIIGILGMTVIAGYFFLNEKKRKSE